MNMKSEVQALVFAIEEFATFDGPGIRTTVFLKGCPLRCMWCHNPEGQSFDSQVVRSPNGCLGCGACLREGERVSGRCELVEESISVCPQNLIRRCGIPYTPLTLANKLEKNIPILNASGGGVTFSGGEPLAHPQFVTETMRFLYGKTSLAVQTCGYTSTDIFKQVLSFADYILYDLKLIDSKRHEFYTGVKNEPILENYRILSRSSVSFITRVPLIPTVTDTVENLEGIARFMYENGVDRVELLPYNPMTGAKYALAGLLWQPAYDEKQTIMPHKEIFESYGISVQIL